MIKDDHLQKRGSSVTLKKIGPFDYEHEYKVDGILKLILTFNIILILIFNV